MGRAHTARLLAADETPEENRVPYHRASRHARGSPREALADFVRELDEDAGVRIKAFVACREGKRPSLIELKRFCSTHLPLYMVPDLFSFPAALPKTSTDKTDYQKLKELA